MNGNFDVQSPAFLGHGNPWQCTMARCRAGCVSGGIGSPGDWLQPCTRHCVKFAGIGIEGRCGVLTSPFTHTLELANLHVHACCTVCALTCEGTHMQTHEQRYSVECLQVFNRHHDYFSRHAFARMHSLMHTCLHKCSFICLSVHASKHKHIRTRTAPRLKREAVDTKYVRMVAELCVF